MFTDDWKKITAHFGLEAQIKHWYTEIRELSQAMDKYQDGKITKQELISEFADNYNFLGQFRTYFDIKEIDIKAEQDLKNKRTLKIVEEKNENIK